jgi:uncharacterized protein YgiM (DUF1202 family)
MKAMRTVCLFIGLAALAALSGCVVTAGPTVYVPQPAPVCPEGYYWSPGYGCVPAVGVVVQPGAVYALVNTEYLSLRSCPTTKCSILASLNVGEQVQVLGNQGGWTHVYVPSRGMEGWVASRYLD